ncbi:hypothetical protein V6N13_029271 [Hibiscus sabdariffa]
MIQLASDPRFAHGLVISWAGPGVLAKLLYANNKARFSRNSKGGGTFVISMMLNPVRCGSKGFRFALHEFTPHFSFTFSHFLSNQTGV